MKRVVELVAEGVANPERFELTAQLLCELNGLAVAGLTENAGKVRTRDVEITSSRHKPPPWQQVPGHLQGLCAFVADGGRGYDAVTLAAFVLWFVNWIHPFEDGNGRVARAAAYLVLSVALGQELPGETTIIDRIVMHKRHHWKLLEAADKAWDEGRGVFDVSEMAAFLRELLEAQLKDD